MCTTTVYIHPDGTRIIDTKGAYLCPDSRYGNACRAHTEIQRALLPAHGPAATIHTPVSSIPPSPRHSPRLSNRDTTSHSDRHSRHSSASSSSRLQRSPGIYVNGLRVAESHSSSSRERTMMPHPPTPRTPPQAQHMPRSAPSSPLSNLAPPHGTSPRERYSRPYHVDERTRGPQLVSGFPPSPPPSSSSSRHSRQASTSSQGSRHSSSSYEREERHRRQEEHEARHSDRKMHELRERVGKANTNIASRRDTSASVQPQQMQPVSERRSRRDSVQDVVVDAMGRLTVEDKKWTARKAHQRALELEQQELEAQNRRLEERLPSRRATVGPSSRRHRVAYEDGHYRYE
ncbi:hypothetical protein A9K55_005339 [Cordyceps militaris]|uniref:Uncharacterized protein n=1 Tax=Cordyceps militaris TaxID=73501 RepID=A0A2H4SPD1_CORMI|nr:hypothetical protein A9K55_005339 [Cordyceps militaris]